MSIQRGVIALVLVACTPTGEDDAPPSIDFEMEPAEPITSGERDQTPATLPWPECEQQYPPLQGSSDEPFVWETGHSTDDDHPCRYGCTRNLANGRPSAPGIGVAILDTEVRVGKRGWHVRMQPEGIVPKHVQWTSWCGREVTLAIHDERTLRLVSISIATGEIVERIEQPIDSERGADPTFAMQMHCWDQHTEIHARGREGAWSIVMPTHGRALRRVPAEVWVEIVARPYGHQLDERERQEVKTRKRRYHRKGHELFASDARDVPLWHRTSVPAWVGCLNGSQLMGLVGCSRCPTRMQGLSVIGDYAFLEDHDLRSSADVFDADGKHIVHLSY